MRDEFFEYFIEKMGEATQQRKFLLKPWINGWENFPDNYYIIGNMKVGTTIRMVYSV
nr:hypothetical protein [Xenorhabdus nematophila]